MKRTTLWFVYFLGHWDRSKSEFVTIMGVITTWLWRWDDKSVVISWRPVNDEVFDDFNRGCYTTRDFNRAPYAMHGTYIARCFSWPVRNVLRFWDVTPYSVVCLFYNDCLMKGRNVFNASDMIILAVKTVNDLMRQGGTKSRRLVVWEHNISA
jgi:hypothetical protein